MFVKSCGKSEYISFGIWDGGWDGGIFVKWGLGWWWDLMRVAGIPVADEYGKCGVWDGGATPIEFYQAAEKKTKPVAFETSIREIRK